VKYTKEKAAEISQKWEVSAATIRTWKHRGEIPDDYQHDPVFLFIAMRKLDSEYISTFAQTIRTLGSEAWADWLRYTQKTQVPEPILEKEIRQRMRDKRTHLREKYI
jgi:hypothetical protein